MDKDTFIGLADVRPAIWRHIVREENKPVDFFTAVEVDRSREESDDVYKCTVTFGSIVLADRDIPDDDSEVFLKHMAIENVWNGIKGEFGSVSMDTLTHECALMGIPYGMGWHLLNRLGILVVD